MNETFLKRRTWFDEHWSVLEQKYFRWHISARLLQIKPQSSFTCPCCGYPILSRRNWYEICHLCWWEDDGHDDPDVHEESGANHRDDLDGPAYTLWEARLNFEKNGIMFDVIDERYQRIGLPSAENRKRLISLFEAISTEQDIRQQKQQFRMITVLLKQIKAL